MVFAVRIIPDFIFLFSFYIYNTVIVIGRDVIHSSDIRMASVIVCML